MLQSGRALKPGTYAESTLNMMADALSLAIEEGKSAEDLILFVREGVVEEQQEEQRVRRQRAKEMKKNQTMRMLMNNRN